MTELYYLSATELAPLIKSRQLSPVELMRTMIERTQMLEPYIDSYITFLPEIALQNAVHAEKKIMEGLYEGPLHGIPIGMKDIFYTKGIRTTAGSKMLYDFVPDINSTAWERLSNSGTILTGKLNCHEFAAGLTNMSPFYGFARNPWNLDCMTGGSSGGSAAALAAGLTTLATGTDTFGSIRVPATMCGVYGLKPTYGLVSKYGVAPLSWSMDHIGPMARSVSDLALMLQHMAGYDPEDATSIKAPVPNYSGNLDKGVKGIKIGIPDYYLEGLDQDVERLFRHAILVLERMGAEVKEVEIPELSIASFSAYMVMMGEAAAYHHEKLKSNPEGFGGDVRIMLETGELANSSQYIQAQQARRKLAKAFKHVFEEVDALVGPTIPLQAPLIQENWVAENLEMTKRCISFTAPPNVTGIPSLSVPIGLSYNGLPIGMQIIGNYLSEKQLLQVGSAWESTNPLGGAVPIK